MSKHNHAGFVFWNGEDYYCQVCGDVLPEAPDYFTEEDIIKLDSFWDRNASALFNAVSISKANLTNRIRDLMSNGRSIDQALDIFKESIGDNNV
jgi:hypothetical protein